MEKNSIWKYVIAAVAVVALGFCIRSGMMNLNSSNRSVQVKGLSEREVKADNVTWPIIYKVVGSDLPGLYDKVETNNNIVLEFLHKNGITDEEISINAPKVQNNVAESWSAERAFDYGLTQVITVKSKNVDLVNKLLIAQRELIKKNIPITMGNSYDTPQIRYDYSGLNTIKPDMIKEATQNARLAAEQFANDSGSSVGDIKHATQGQFSIEDRDENTPYIKTVRVVTTVEFCLD